ncbi:MAG: DUF4868 domain-containing protein [Clostridia bacterium]|jgi:hypothetical protein|nr:DUF4868 domain-containing protein [Clostridia bacterium]
MSQSNEKVLKNIKDFRKTLNKQKNIIKIFFIIKRQKDGEKYYEALRLSSLKAIKEKATEEFGNCLNKKDDKSITDYELIEDEKALEENMWVYRNVDSTNYEKMLEDVLIKGLDTGDVKDLNKIRNRLHSYAIVIEANNKKIILLKKYSKSAIYKETKNKILMFFDTDESKIGLAKGSFLNIDFRYDAIYYDKEFLVLNKHKFEQILDLESQFKDVATNFIKEKINDIISGVDVLEELVKTNKIIAKKLAKVSMNIDTCKNAEIEVSKMIEVSKEIGKSLNTEKNKIIISNKEDAEILVQLLSKNYVKCMQTGEKYEVHSKKKI